MIKMNKVGIRHIIKQNLKPQVIAKKNRKPTVKSIQYIKMEDKQLISLIYIFF